MNKSCGKWRRKIKEIVDMESCMEQPVSHVSDTLCFQGEYLEKIFKKL